MKFICAKCEKEKEGNINGSIKFPYCDECAKKHGEEKYWKEYNKHLSE